MSEQWLQRDVEDKRRKEKRQRREERRKEKRQRMEERRLRRRLRRMEEERRGELELWQRMEERIEEERRQRMEEEKRERFRRRWDSEPDLVRQIEEMAADSADVESIESALVNEDTVQFSLEQELERKKEQQQLALQENLQENERRLLAGELLLLELEREKELDQLAGVEEWRKWEEEWRNLQWEQEGMELESFKPAPAAQESLLTEDVMGELASTESVVVNEDTEEQQPLIGGMEADFTDVASIIFSDHTEVLFSLEREQEKEVLELESLMPVPAAREPLLTEDVMDGLASTESVVDNEDTEEQQPLIGGMEADSTDVASIIAGVVNQDTEVLLSLEREQEQEPLQAPGARVDLDWIFVITNFILELPSAVFDQLSSVRKPQFALLGMLMSYAALFICIIELVYICRKEKVTWKWRGTLPWLYYPSQKPFGSFEDIIGLVCAICQCVVATIAYSFCLRHADNPIKISIWPIIFAFGLLCSKLLRDRRESRSTTQPPASRRDIHQNLSHYC